jgi:hypothetical protein
MRFQQRLATLLKARSATCFEDSINDQPKNRNFDSETGEEAAIVSFAQASTFLTYLTKIN